MFAIRRSLVLLSAICAFGVAEARLERNAFITAPVRSVGDLVRMVRTDPVVRDRYMRHYAMTEPRLVAYFQGLRPARLTSAGLYRVYGAPANGMLHSTIQRLPVGEPIFVQADGEPVMLIRCGNPMNRGPESPLEPNPVMALQYVPPVEIKEVTIPEITAEVVDNPELVAEIIEPDMPATPVAVVPPPPPVVTPGASAIPIASAPGIGWLLPILGIPFLGDTPSDGGPAVIPEPGTIFALGVGAAVLLRRRRKTSA